MHKSHLFCNEQMDDFQTLSMCGGSLILYTSPFLEYGNKNQDSVAVFELDKQTCVIAIADGIGGSRGGGQASSSIMNKIDELLKNFSSKELLNNAHQIFSECNNAVKDLSVGAGSTLTLLLIHQEQGKILYTGDSEAWHFSGTGQQKRKTLSFSVGGFAKESGFKEKELPEKIKAEQNHLITYMGAEFPRYFTEGPFQVNPRDLFFLCTDGVSENISSNTLEQVVSESTMQKRGEYLLKKVKEYMSSDKGKPDDHSFIIFDLAKSESTLPKVESETEVPKEK